MSVLTLTRPRPATLCPVCGGITAPHHTAGLRLCLTCAETLAPVDLVKRATRRTRAAHLAKNSI